MEQNSEEIKKIKRGNMMIMLSMFVIPLLIVVAIVGSNSYFNTKEINELKNKCEQSGGKSELDTTVFNIQYTFECK